MIEKFITLKVIILIMLINTMLLVVFVCADENFPTTSEQAYKVISSADELNKYPGIKNFIKAIRDYDNQQRVDPKHEYVEIGINKLTIGGKYLQKFSGNSVISDLSSVIKTFPGVVTKGDLDANIYVRGGNSYEVTTVIDDQVSYSPFFWYGKINMINPKLIDSISFYSGGFPAKYGRMMSGVLDIKQITGDTEKNHVELDQNLTEFNYLMHGPIKSGESSWLFSARKTYYDMLINYLYPRTTVMPGFESYFSKLYFRLSPVHKLYLSQQSYSDIMRVDDNILFMEPDADYRNTYSRLQYLVKLESNWTDAITSRINAGWENYSQYHYFKSSDRMLETAQSRTPMFLSADLEAKNSQHNFALGGYASREKIGYAEDASSPPDPAYPLSVSLNTRTDYNYQYYYSGIYAQDEFTIVPKELAINLGARYCSLLNKSLPKAKSFQPRAILYVGDKDNTVFILSAGKYAIFNNPVLSGSLINVAPEQAIHYSAGLQQYLDESTVWKAEVFYKNYYSLVRELRDTSTGQIIGYDNQKSGIATGFEFMLQRKDIDNWGAALSYTLSSIQYRDPAHDWYYGDHDQHHTLNLSGIYKFNPDWKMSGNLYAASGKPYTDITSATFETTRNIWVPLMGDLNVARQPYVCKLDLCFEYARPIWPFDKNQGSVYFGLSNVLNFKNIYKYYWSSDYKVRKSLAMLPILPVFGIKVVF